MTELLPYLGPWAQPLAVFAAGGISVLLFKKYVRKEAVTQFQGAAQPFMDAIKPLLGLPRDVQSVRDQLSEQRQMIESIRGAMGQISQEAAAAHTMAVKALETATRVEGAHGATASTLATHMYRHPHNHNGAAGYNEP